MSAHGIALIDWLYIMTSTDTIDDIDGVDQRVMLDMTGTIGACNGISVILPFSAGKIMRLAFHYNNAFHIICGVSDHIFDQFSFIRIAKREQSV